MLVCENCGSSDVEILAWVKDNTNEYSSEGPDAGNKNNCWCCDCQSHVQLTDEEVYKQNQEED